MTNADGSLGMVGSPPVAELAAARWDAVVVGAGHNGLTAAAYLARAGKRVLVLERSDRVGGACRLEETWPGYRISPCAYLVGLLHPLVVEELALERRGYRPTVLDPQLFVPFPDGSAFVEWGDDERAVASVRRLAPGQERGYLAYRRVWQEMRDALRPPGPDDVWLGEAPDRAELEARLEHDPVKVSALFESSMIEHLGRFFDDDRMIDALAGQGVIGTNASPFDPGTASIAFHHASGRLGSGHGDWGFVEGGMGRVSFAIHAAAVEAGSVVAVGLPVARIVPGRGVELESGHVVRAPVVISNADPKRTVALLGDAAPDDLRERVQSLPTDSPVVKVTYALDEPPVFVGAREELGAGVPVGMVNVSAGARALHEAHRTALEGRLPAEPWAELYVQTAVDPSIAPPGRHVVSAFCQYFPTRPAGETWDEIRDTAGDLVDAAIERLAPGFTAHVVGRKLDAPPDLELRLGLTGGHIFHGECLPEFMWNRRLPYRLVDGVYLCGAGTHPGGSVIAVNGRNAAMAVLADHG